MFSSEARPGVLNIRPGGQNQAQQRRPHEAFAKCTERHEFFILNCIFISFLGLLLLIETSPMTVHESNEIIEKFHVFLINYKNVCFFHIVAQLKNIFCELTETVCFIIGGMSFLYFYTFILYRVSSNSHTDTFLTQAAFFFFIMQTCCWNLTIYICQALNV